MGEISESGTLAGLPNLLNLIASTLGSQPALNLKQKAEKTLVPLPRAAQLLRPAKPRESLLVNLEFW